MSATRNEVIGRPKPTAMPRRWWAWWGVAAGLLGLIATIVSDVRAGAGELAPPVSAASLGTFETIDRLLQYVGYLAGYLAVAALLVLAAAWRRRLEPEVPMSIAAGVVPGGLVASAGALTLAYGWKGALALYSPGGLNAGEYDPDALFVYFMLNDFGPYLGWLGVVAAAGAMAWMGLRDRSIPLWIGIVAGLVTLATAAFAGILGVPGAPGLPGPLFLVVAFTGLALTRSRPVSAVPAAP